MKKEEQENKFLLVRYYFTTCLGSLLLKSYRDESGNGKDRNRIRVIMPERDEISSLTSDSSSEWVVLLAVMDGRNRVVMSERDDISREWGSFWSRIVHDMSPTHWTLLLLSVHLTSQPPCGLVAKSSETLEVRITKELWLWEGWSYLSQSLGRTGHFNHFPW